MSRTRWVPAPPDRRESILSGLVGAAVGIGAGLATWYLTRTLLAREPVEQSFDRDPLPPKRRIEPSRPEARDTRAAAANRAGARGSAEGSATA